MEYTSEPASVHGNESDNKSLGANEGNFCVPVRDFSQSYAQSIYGNLNSKSPLCDKFPAEDWESLKIHQFESFKEAKLLMDTYAYIFENRTYKRLNSSGGIGKNIRTYYTCACCGVSRLKIVQSSKSDKFQIICDSHEHSDDCFSQLPMFNKNCGQPKVISNLSSVINFVRENVTNVKAESLKNSQVWN